MPPIPVERTSVSTLIAIPVPVKKKNTLVIVLAAFFIIASLVVAGSFAYQKFVKPMYINQMVKVSGQGETTSTDIQTGKIPLGGVQGTENKDNIQTESPNQATSSDPMASNEKSQQGPTNIQSKTGLVSPETQSQARNSIRPTEAISEKKTPENPKVIEQGKKTTKKQWKPDPKRTTVTKTQGPEKVFKKEGQGLQILALHKVFSGYETRIEKFKKRVQSMQFGERRAQFSREINLGRLSLGNSTKIPAAVHFYRAVILQPRNKDGYAWLTATLVDLKAYEDARKVIKKAGEQGVSVSEMNKNMRFKIAYQKLQMH